MGLSLRQVTRWTPKLTFVSPGATSRLAEQARAVATPHLRSGGRAVKYYHHKKAPIDEVWRHPLRGNYVVRLHRVMGNYEAVDPLQAVFSLFFVYFVSCHKGHFPPNLSFLQG